MAKERCEMIGKIKRYSIRIYCNLSIILVSFMLVHVLLQMLGLKLNWDVNLNSYVAFFGVPSDITICSTNVTNGGAIQHV